MRLCDFKDRDRDRGGEGRLRETRLRIWGGRLLALAPGPAVVLFAAGLGVV